jgi:succinyl-CoA synthetase beta subunit
MAYRAEERTKPAIKAVANALLGSSTVLKSDAITALRAKAGGIKYAGCTLSASHPEISTVITAKGTKIVVAFAKICVASRLLSNWPVSTKLVNHKII